MATVSYVPNDPLASGGPPTRSTRASNYPRGDIAKFDIQPTAVAGKFDPHTPEFQYWQAKLGADRRAACMAPDRWPLPATLVRRPEPAAGAHGRRRRPERVLRPRQPAVLLTHVRRRDGQLGGERGRRDPRRGSCLPRRHPAGLLRCPVHRSRRAPRGVRRLHGDRHRARGPRHPGRRPGVDPGPRGQPLRGKPGRGARRRDRAGVRSEQRRRRRAAPCPQHVPVVRPDLAAAGCTRGPALRRGPQLRPGVQWRLLRRHPEHLHRGQTEGFAGAAEGLADGGQAAGGGHPRSCPPRRARSAASASGCSRSTWR